MGAGPEVLPQAGDAGSCGTNNKEEGQGGGHQKGAVGEGAALTAAARSQPQADALFNVAAGRVHLGESVVYQLFIGGSVHKQSSFAQDG